MSRHLRFKDLLPSMIGVGGAAAAAQVLMLVAMPLTSRLYSAEDFGRFGLFFGLTNTLSVFAVLGLQDSLLAISNHSEAKAVLKASFTLAAASLLPLSMFAYVLISKDLFGYGSLGGWSAALVGGSSVAIAVSMSAQVALIRNMKFGQLASGHIALGASKPLLQIGAGVGALGYFGLASAEIGSRLFTAMILIRKAYGSFGKVEAESLRTSFSLAWKHRRFVIFRTPSILLFAIGTALPAILITEAYGLGAAGTYTLMFSVVAGPLGLIQKAVGDVFLGHFTQRLRISSESARQFLIVTARFLFLCSLIPGALLAISGPSIFALVFGDPWRGSGELAQLMAPLFVADMTIGPLGSSLNALNLPGRKLYFDCARILGILGSYWFVVTQELELESMIISMTCLGFIGYVAYLALMLSAFRVVASNATKAD